MSRQRLTLDGARHLNYEDLVSAAYGLIEAYEGPEVETHDELEKRISRTLDELPDVYAWLNRLHAYFDHFTDFNKDQYGQQSLDFKLMREKRDAMEKAASSAKLRYEATSRRMTQLQRHEEESRTRHAR